MWIENHGEQLQPVIDDVDPCEQCSNLCPPFIQTDFPVHGL